MVFSMSDKKAMVERGARRTGGPTDRLRFKDTTFWFVLLRDGVKSVGVVLHLSPDSLSLIYCGGAGGAMRTGAPPPATSFVRILGAPWRLNLSIADYATSSVAAP